MLNQVLLCGRLVKEPDLLTSKNGIKYARITLAVQREIRNKEDGSKETDFFEITLWQGLAELAQSTCKKGALIIIKGRLEIGDYINKENKKIKKVNIIGERITYLDPKQSQVEIDETSNIENLEE